MPFNLVRQDITKMKVDAIVNAANTELKQGGGVCGAIFAAAGEQELQDACEPLAPIETGTAVITPGFNLHAKYIIHTAGPIYDDKNKDKCRKLLCSCYRESMELAVKNRCRSVAFPLISSGIYGYPKAAALEAARETISEFLLTNELNVYLCVYDTLGFVLSNSIFSDVESYIDEFYIDEHFCGRSFLPKKMILSEPMAPSADVRLGSNIDDALKQLDEPFADTLFRFIDSKKMTDVEVYKRANIDRRHFSKIRSTKGYTPKKPTIFALAIALELSLDETEFLLKSAGYAISHASKFDVIVEFFIVNKKYDIFEINEVLFKYDQVLLGG